MSLKEPELKTLCDELADPKLILTLSKYIFKAFEFIAAKDACKYIEIYLISHIILFYIELKNVNIVDGQYLLKVQNAIKEKMGNCCILKA